MMIAGGEVGPRRTSHVGRRLDSVLQQRRTESTTV